MTAPRPGRWERRLGPSGPAKDLTSRCPAPARGGYALDARLYLFDHRAQRSRSHTQPRLELVPRKTGRGRGGGVRVAVIFEPPVGPPSSPGWSRRWRPGPGPQKRPHIRRSAAAPTWSASPQSGRDHPGRWSHRAHGTAITWPPRRTGQARRTPRLCIPVCRSSLRKSNRVSSSRDVLVAVTGPGRRG